MDPGTRLQQAPLALLVDAALLHSSAVGAPPVSPDLDRAETEWRDTMSLRPLVSERRDPESSVQRADDAAQRQPRTDLSVVRSMTRLAQPAEACDGRLGRVDDRRC